MATRKRNVEIEFIVDDRKAQKSLQNIEKDVSKTGKAFSTAGKLVAGAFAGGQILDFAQSSITAFSDLNESLNAVEVTFGGAAEGIKQLGEEAAQKFGLSNAEFNSFAVGFSAFAEQIAQQSGTTVIPVIDDMTTRIADFASVMNLEVGEAAEKFRSGLAGETEPLRQFGIDVSAAAVNQQALAMGLGDASGKLTEQEKILARYELIMSQTEKTAGDFANTSDSLANQQRILAAEAENAQAQLGERLAPALEGLQDAGGDAVTILAAVATALDGTDKAAKTNDESLRLFAGGALSFVVDMLDKTADKLNDMEKAQREAEAAQLDAIKATEGQTSRAAVADQVLLGHIRTVDDAAGSYTEAKEELVKWREELDNLAAPTKNAFLAIQEYTEAVDAHTEAVAENGEESDEAIATALAQGDAWSELQEALGDLLPNLEGNTDAFRDWLEEAGVAPEIIQEIIDKILEFNNTPVRSIGGFITDETGAIVGRQFDGALEGRAMGGPVSAGLAYMVGEQGPEMFVPNLPGTIVPNHHMGATSGHGQATPTAIVPRTATPQIDGSGGTPQIVINGFVGSEPVLAAELDKILTTRARKASLALTNPSSGPDATDPVFEI